MGHMGLDTLNMYNIDGKGKFSFSLAPSQLAKRCTRAKALKRHHRLFMSLTELDVRKGSNIFQHPPCFTMVFCVGV
jgi:hypothetical protein